MNPQLLYQEDSATLEFNAQIVEIITLPDGRRGVILDRSYFYPTGGGQEHDTGIINSAKVVDVYKDENHPHLVHVVEGEVSPGEVTARIDADRRLRHMQHHTAQHLLTQCILKVTGSETVSANINGYTPSTLDVVATQINISDLDQAEQMANGIIYKDRIVKTYIVTPDELKALPLRRPPKVSEDIRIVEIDAFDYSPCGGTHVSHTGSIGLIKVVKTERQNDRVRVHFIAGLQAMQVFHQMYESMNALAMRQSIAWQDIPDQFTRQSDQISALQKDVQNLRAQLAGYEALELAARAEPRGPIRLLRASFENRPVSELRQLGEQLKKITDLVACLTSFDGQKVSLLVTCGESSGLDARHLLNQQLSRLNGRGGGDTRLAQGGGAATIEDYRRFVEHLDLE